MKTHVKLISGLKDWSRDLKKQIPEGTAAARNMNGVVPGEMGLFKDDRGCYHTSGFVGVGWLKDSQGRVVRHAATGEKTALIVSPRFSMNPWKMLIKVMNDPEYELYASGQDGDFFEIYTGEDLIPVPGTQGGGELLAAISFCKECEKICKKHLRQAMDFREGNFQGKVIGNIQVAKHIKRNIAQAREDRVYCRYPVFTVDTLENRIMKAALIKAGKILRKNGIRVSDTGRIYSYCENALKAVRTAGISKSDFSRINVSGFHAYYKPVMDLSKTILLGKGVNDLSGRETHETEYVLPYAINMERLFEFYIRAVLKEYLRKHPDAGLMLDEYRMPRKNALLTLKAPDRRAYLMEHYVPDIALIEQAQEGRRYAAVFDVKYQNSTHTVYYEARRQNSHQLLFYTLLLNVSKCGFIFPKQTTEDETGEIQRYELNIQSGNAMEAGRREYTQWAASGYEDRLAEQIVQYVKGT